LLRVLAARARLRGSVSQNGPATVGTADHRLSEHSSNQRAAASTAARTSAHAGAFAHLLERLSAGLNSFDYSAFADLVTKTGGLEILDHRLFSGFLFQFVDGEYLAFAVKS
jgi:hypothetical protein